MAELRKILSIDGGGIRGIIPGQVIVEIEKEFGIKVADHFDLLAGTSTGGILTCAYLLPQKEDATKPLFNAEEVVGLYFNEGEEIFKVSFFDKLKTFWGVFNRKYPEHGMESALDEYMGDVWLKDLLKPCIITTYDIENRKGLFFGQQKAKENPDFNFKVKDIARATSAAPTYFECKQVQSEAGNEYALIDGGVFVNNPSIVAYAETRRLHEDTTASDMKILSIGTGHSRQKYEFNKARKWGMIGWIQPVIDIMMSGSADVAHYQLEKIYGTIDNPYQYLRVDAALDSYKGIDINPEMDVATDKNMQQLKAFGKRLFQENKAKIEEWLVL